jgi:hypothetical protein
MMKVVERNPELYQVCEELVNTSLEDGPAYNPDLAEQMTDAVYNDDPDMQVRDAMIGITVLIALIYQGFYRQAERSLKSVPRMTILQAASKEVLKMVTGTSIMLSRKIH